MDIRQELYEIESLARALNERARDLRQKVSGEPEAEENISLGLRLRRLRALRGWTQERLAEESGISVNGIIKIENGSTTKPRINTITKLANALGIGLDELEA